MNEYIQLLVLENPFDLNECYMLCDSYAKKYNNLYNGHAINSLTEWNDIFQALYKLAYERFQTLDLNEAVIDANELALFTYQGLILNEGPLIKNENIAINFMLTSDKIHCTINFKADETIFFDLPEQIQNSQILYKKAFENNFIKIDLTGTLTDLLNDGFSFASNSLLAANTQFFFLKLRDFCDQNHLKFSFPNWYLLYRLNYLSDDILNNMQIDTKIVAAAALNQISNDNKIFARKNIQLAKDKLKDDFNKLADFFYYQIFYYCLQNN